MTIIKYNLQELPPAILNKSLRAKQAFLSGYTSAINRGLTDDESYFSGLSQATTVERTEKAQKQPLEPIKPKVPQHVAILLEKRSEVATALPSVAPRIKQEFLGKNALVPDSERSLVSATWDKNGRLLLQFDDGQKIVTDPVPVSENIEQYVSISANTTSTGADLSNVSSIQFDTNAGVAVGVGELAWNNTDGTLDLGLKGGNVTLQLGQELLTHVYNNTANDFSDLQVLRITGSQGQRLTGDLAQANSAASSNNTYAVVTEPILKNKVGFATTHGLVRGVDTSAFPEGAALYLSPTIAGAITSNKPSAPNYALMIGWCVRSHAVQGSIYVNVQNGFELEELHNVQITNPQQDQVLAYNASTNIWENKAQQAIYTDVTLQKTVAETASTSINFSNRLQQGEVVVSTTSVVASPSGLTILDITNTSTNAVFKIVGGTLLQGYQIDITVLTSLSNSLTARIYLLII